MLIRSIWSIKSIKSIFFIDPKGIIRSLLYYPMSAGRNFAEIKRLLIAMQTADKHGVATPADWQPGEDVIVPPPTSTKAARERMKAAPEKDTKVVDWFLSFKKLPADTPKK